MAPPKTPEDVEIAKVNAGLKKAQAICGVINNAIIAGAISICFAVACWATVQIVTKPPWLEITLAIIAAVGGQSMVIWRLSARLRRQVTLEEEAEKPPGITKQGGAP